MDINNTGFMIKKIIIGSCALVGIVAIYYYFKKKNSTTSTSDSSANANPIQQTVTAVENAVSTAVSTGPVMDAINAVKTATGTATSTPNNTPFTSVVAVQNKAVLVGVVGMALKTGDQVTVVSPVYNGTFKVWYVFQYSNASTSQNIYIDTPFISSTSGTVTKYVPLS